VAASPGAQPATVPEGTGHQRLTFTERHPLSTLDEVVRRMDIHFDTMVAADVALAKQEYDLAAESFEVFVPATYKPDVPHGLFIWLGVPPVSPDWLEVFARCRLISVTAIAANGRVGFSRLRLPLDAVHNLKQRCRIDESRIYVAGFSAGAGLASHLVCGIPEVFRGGYFLMGGGFCVPHKTASVTAPTGPHQARVWRRT
jgi:hypothetical protein